MIKNLVEINLHCIAIVVSTVPIATLDHLREREDLRCSLPLPQLPSLSEAEIALRDLVDTTPHVDRAQHFWKETEQDRPFPSWHSQNGNQDYGRIVSTYLNGLTEFKFKHWDDLVMCSSCQFQTVMQEAFKWNVPRQEAKTLTRQLAIEDLGFHIDGVFGAVLAPHPFDVNLGAATLWMLSQSRPQHMDLQIIAGRKSRKFHYRRETSSVFHFVWFTLGDTSLRMQPGAAFPVYLAGELVHALMLMPFMFMDLRLPTSGTVVATDASEYGQGVCRTVGFTATAKLEAKRRETQSIQRWDNCIGLVVVLRGFTSWRAAFDVLGIQPAIFAFVGRRPTSNRETWSVVFVTVLPSCVTSHWMRQVMDYAPSVTHWCLGRRNLEPEDAQDVFHLRNFILQHTSFVAVSFLVTAPVDFSREAVKAKLQHLKTWPKLVCPSAQSDLSSPMLVWLSWNVLVSDEQTGESESFPSFTMVSISGAHHRHFRPGWALAGGAGAKLPNLPLDSRLASAGLTSGATRDVQGFELCQLGFVGLFKVFTQQLFAPSGTIQRVSNVAAAAGQTPKMLS